VIAKLCTFILALALAGGAYAQEKKRIEKAADMPRFTYKVDGKLDEVVQNDAKFKAFSSELRRDTESVLAQYDIADKAMLRQELGVILRLDYLEGRYDDALKVAARVRDLEEKPADKLLSGLTIRAMIGAERKVGNRTSDAYRAEVNRLISAELAGIPYEVVQNEIKEGKAGAEILSEALALGYIREAMQPTVDQAGALSSDLAPALVNARYRIVAILPLKDTLVSTYGTYLAAHKVDKPDIWAARDTTVPSDKGGKPVNIAIWDSGVDTALFPAKVVKGADGKPAVIAFDKYANPATGELQAIPADLRNRVPQLKSRLKGFSDLQANIDSPEATELKKFLSTLKPDEYKSTIEEINLAGNWMHGTHVAGIAVAGNPFAQIVVARIEFGHTLRPDPCPSQELAERDARNMQAYVDFMKKNGVRVVNMSWGGSVKGIEEDLELCGIGKTPDERKAIARKYFDLQKNALAKAFASAPDILFVAAAGNANSDSTFAEQIPAAIDAPNLLTVGAVDKAGDEASFTSYGPTVVVHANGYQVESVIPGGEKLAESGTSMASPQVANLAGKILAVNPSLKPKDVIALIRDTAEKTADGRRTLVNPKKAVDTAMKKAA
jgi:subtilisin family serine protease